MVLGRFRDAVSDAAETLRRVFVDPPCHGLDLGHFAVVTGRVEVPEAMAREGQLLQAPAVGGAALQMAPTEGRMPLLDQVRLVAETGWAQWSSGATVVTVPALAADGCRRETIPPLPRKVGARTERLGFGVPGVRSEAVRLASPRSGQARPELPRPRVREDLAGMRARPVAVRGELPEAMGAAWTMRQVLHLVRQSGENARNLELLGCFPVPRDGLLGLAHDAREGCLWVQLGPAAARSPRQRLILARRKDDRTLVSCVMEEP